MLMEANYISITAEEYYKLEDKTTLLAWLRDNFPYKSYSMSEEYLKNSLKELSSYKPVLLKRSFCIANLEEFSAKQLLYRGQPCILAVYNDYYDKYNKAVEYFSDPTRMTAKLLGKLSPLEQWQTETANFVHSCLSTYGRLDAYTLRETVYSLASECTEFKTSIAAALMWMFKPKSILDFSAGRGPRLMAAIAKGIDYTGVDPDIRAIQCCQSIANFFGQGRVTLIHALFQDITLPQRYDMVLTSPPYFTLEHYCDDDTQSTTMFPTLDGWLQGFLYPSLEKAWSYLNVGGHMIININDFHKAMVPRYKFTKLAVNFVSRLSGNEYLGVIGSALVENNKLKHTQPFWIWKKVK